MFNKAFCKNKIVSRCGEKMLKRKKKMNEARERRIKVKLCQENVNL